QPLQGLVGQDVVWIRPDQDRRHLALRLGQRFVRVGVSGMIVVVGIMVVFVVGVFLVTMLVLAMFLGVVFVVGLVMGVVGGAGFVVVGLMIVVVVRVTGGLKPAARLGSFVVVIRVFSVLCVRLGRLRMSAQQIKPFHVHEQRAVVGRAGRSKDADDFEGVMLVSLLVVFDAVRGLEFIAQFQPSLVRHDRADDALEEMLVL